MHTSDCDANASFSSTRSRSPTSMPARASALRDAGTGPTPMIAGSTPATPVATIRASGFSPSSRARSASTTSVAAAPSLMPEAFPGGHRAALAERRPQLPERLQRGVRARVLVARDDDRVALLLGHGHGHDLVVEVARPRSAAIARWCERSANASCRSRETSYRSP